MKHKEEISHVVFHLLVFSILLTTNIYLLLFVHNKYDLAPNFALAIITVPVAIWSLIRLNTGKVNTRERNSSRSSAEVK